MLKFIEKQFEDQKEKNEGQSKWSNWISVTDIDNFSKAEPSIHMILSVLIWRWILPNITKLKILVIIALSVNFGLDSALNIWRFPQGSLAIWQVSKKSDSFHLPTQKVS